MCIFLFQNISSKLIFCFKNFFRLDSRDERRQKEKEKRKAKIAKRKLENPDLPSYSESRKVLKKSINAKEYSKVHIIFDFGFSKFMSQRDRGKCLKQLLRCYSMNRRYEHPMNIHITSFEGLMKDEMSRHNGYENWNAKFHTDSYATGHTECQFLFLWILAYVFQKQNFTMFQNILKTAVDNYENHHQSTSKPINRFFRILLTFHRN